MATANRLGVANMPSPCWARPHSLRFISNSAAAVSLRSKRSDIVNFGAANEVLSVPGLWKLHALTNTVVEHPAFDACSVLGMAVRDDLVDHIPFVARPMKAGQ